MGTNPDVVVEIERDINVSMQIGATSERINVTPRRASCCAESPSSMRSTGTPLGEHL